MILIMIWTSVLLIEAATSGSAVSVSFTMYMHSGSLWHCDYFLFAWCFFGQSSEAKKSRPVKAVKDVFACHIFCARQYREQQLTHRGCCGWLSRTSFVYVLGFGWLWWVSVKDSLCSSLICGCGGKFSFGIWVHTAWKPRSQHFISEWGQLSHTSHNGCTHIHKHSLTHSHTRTHRDMHTLTQFGPA